MNNLRRLRKEKSLTQEELSQKVNIYRATISRLESGKSTFTLEQLEILSDFFDVDIKYMLAKEMNVTAKKVPIYSQVYVDGGNITLREEDYRGTFQVIDDIDTENCFNYIATDDSMKSLGIVRGDILLVRITDNVEDNNLIVVNTTQTNSIVRKLIRVEDKSLLMSDSGYELMADSYTLIGKVLLFSRRV